MTRRQVILCAAVSSVTFWVGFVVGYLQGAVQ